MEDLIIIGASGFGREVAWLVERINTVEKKWNLLGFVDDNLNKGSIVNNYKVLGDTEWLKNQQDVAKVVCAIGSSKVRKKVVENLNSKTFATLIDPKAILSDRVNIGDGSIVCASTIITTDVKIGNHVIINLDCTIGHDAQLKDYVTLYPSVNISGNTVLNNCVEMGTGSQIIQGLTIEELTIVGAGAVVVKDLPKNCTAVGLPAKPIKYN